MCLAVYLASDQDLPLLAWEEHAPAFHVDVLKDTDEPVSAHFSWPHVRYLGAHTFCGCGFQAGEASEFGSLPPDQAQREQTLCQLAVYLEQRLRDGAHLQIFACWEGDQAKKPLERRRLAPANIGASEFWFHELELIDVSAL